MGYYKTKDDEKWINLDGTPYFSGNELNTDYKVMLYSDLYPIEFLKIDPYLMVKSLNTKIRKDEFHNYSKSIEKEEQRLGRPLNSQEKFDLLKDPKKSSKKVELVLTFSQFQVKLKNINPIVSPAQIDKYIKLLQFIFAQNMDHAAIKTYMEL